MLQGHPTTVFSQILWNYLECAILKCYWDENHMVFFLDFFILSWRLYPKVDKKMCPRLTWQWFTSVKAARKCANFVRHYSNDNYSSPQFLSSGVLSVTSSYHLAKSSRRMFLVNRMRGNVVFFKVLSFPSSLWPDWERREYQHRRIA